MRAIRLMVVVPYPERMQIKMSWEEVHRMESRKVPNSDLPVSSAPGGRALYSPSTSVWQYAQSIANQLSLPDEPQCFQFLLRLHLVGMIDSLGDLSCQVD